MHSEANEIGDLYLDSGGLHIDVHNYPLRLTNAQYSHIPIQVMEQCFWFMPIDFTARNWRQCIRAANLNIKTDKVDRQEAERVLERLKTTDDLAEMNACIRTLNDMVKN